MSTLDELALLEEERASLLRSLTDLEREYEAGDLDDADYHALKDDYTVRAADVLRRKADLESGHTRKVDAARVARSQRPTWRTPVIVIATFATALGAGLAVARFAGERVGNQGLTGSIRSASADTSPTMTGDRSGEVNALLAKAQQNLSADPLVALQSYDQVLTIDPENPEAIAYGGWLLRLVAQSAEGDQKTELINRAKARLDNAVAIAPKYPDARAFRGILFLRDLGDAESAKADFTALDALKPPPFVLQLVSAARAEADAAVKDGSSPTTTSASSSTS